MRENHSAPAPYLRAAVSGGQDRLWVRLPNWLGDVVMAVPILRAIKADFPRLKMTLLGKGAFIPLIEPLGLADELLPLPEHGRGYYRHFRRLRHKAPHHYLLFTNSLRGDVEAMLTGCPRRFGMIRPGKPRPLLTQAFRLSRELDETQVHQTRVWQQMAHQWGLEAEPDCSPLRWGTTPAPAVNIGLICGTENSPEKRWPIERWRDLINTLLQTEPGVILTLYGTPSDRAITDQICLGMDAARVHNRAGETDLAQFCDALSRAALVCCNDTGGMHLANLLGTPVVAVFGPTNPVRTGPVFDAPHQVLQPPDCPPTGGRGIEGVSVERCAQAITTLLNDKAMIRE